MSDFTGPFEKFLHSCMPPSNVRLIEQGGETGFWRELAQSGFLDALVPESAGGAGMSLSDACPLFQALGRQAMPYPVAETMMARQMLALAGLEPPEGAIAFAVAPVSGPLRVCGGLLADHVLIDRHDTLELASRREKESTGVTGDMTITMPKATTLGPTLARPEGGLRLLGALVRTTLMAGAASQVLDLTTAYANQRVQFGKSIGKQQALQQMLAVMAEDCVALRLAAELACSGDGPPRLTAVAAAKSVASEAAARIANTAHAVFGAIGISAEHDLQLFTRRLHDWRIADGAESYWNRLLGHARLDSEKPSIDWIRQTVFV